MMGLSQWSPSHILPAIRQQIRTAAQITSIHAVTSIRTTPPSKQHTIEEANKRKQLLDRPGLFGIKRGMMTWFTPQGEQHAATVIEVDSVEILGHKTREQWGYDANIVGTIDKLKNVAQPQLKMFEEAGTAPKFKFGEFRVRDGSGLIPVGTELKADYFAVGQLVDIKGITKGKGFAGVMKRWDFKGGRASHGVSKAHRKPGATGGNQNPGRVFPGKKMAGRMGGKNSTDFNKEVLHTDADAGILIVKGCIPGPNKSIVRVADAIKLYGKRIGQT
ncbi:mitochondrial 54S ribosomal protein uL3m [Lodderomyces beijingensis]|uniref:Large ribosomal subunit protein uL3m n=1 Tax=Lodderomyces beijingensis TaxID=1775926 RepID=A0ABP0ZE05_9ASCO